MKDIEHIVDELHWLGAGLESDLNVATTADELRDLIRTATARAMRCVIEAGQIGVDIGPPNAPGNVNKGFLPTLAEHYGGLDAIVRTDAEWEQAWEAHLVPPTERREALGSAGLRITMTTAAVPRSLTLPASELK